MKILNLLLLLFFLASCNQNQNKTFSSVLNESQLESQFFSININTDTTLLTKKGCIIKIPKGSLESEDNNVKLEIKEAITVTDIVLAGMTTQSNQQALSSGGMIYFNSASGYKISIKKSLQVLVPTNSYNRDMKVYKGENKSNKINWIDPTPLPNDTTRQIIDEGERLFKTYCSSCHKIYEDYAAPALYGITDRRSKKWLYNYTRHSTDISTSYGEEVTDSIGFYTDPYSMCLRYKFGTLMPSFPDFRNEDLDKLYCYIKSETDKRPDLKYKMAKTCCDSCESYNRQLNSLNKKKQILLSENGEFFNLERSIQLPIPNVDKEIIQNNIAPPAPPYSKVTPVSASAVYYTINISAVGWYNIDCMMKNYSGLVPSELFVRIKGEYKVDFNVALIIPSVKAFVEGGKLKDGDQYGFDEDNGKIPLPQNARAYILAFGETNNKLIFGKTVFNTELKQTINVSVEESTKEKMMAEIKLLDLDGIDSKISKSRNADKIVETNEKLKAVEKLKPKNCNCDLFFNAQILNSEVPLN